MEISTADGDVRYVPEEVHSQNFCSIAHESRYQWVTKMFEVNGKKILDFGCGSGYGAGFLASMGADVLGVDISATSIDYATQTYPLSRFRAFDLTDSSLVSEIKDQFDMIVSFDVIEHVEKYWVFVDNIKALTKEGGVAIIGCPNRLATFDFNTGWNLYHKQEFTPVQLSWLLSLKFASVAVYGQDLLNNDIKMKMIKKVRDASAKRNFFSKLLYYISKKINKLTASSHIDQNNLEMTFSSIDLDKADSHGIPYGLVAVCR